jgi:POT family proton-dependent oligopeptide transporter
VNVFVGIALLVAAVVACLAIYQGGLPKEAGAPPDIERLRRAVLGPISLEWITYIAAAVAIVAFILLVSGFAPLTEDNRGITLISDSLIKEIQGDGGAVREVVSVVLQEMSRPAGLVLILSGLLGTVYLLFETFRLQKVPRERMFVVMILTFFSMLFWSFFEQAGSSVNNFTDRNVDRIAEMRVVTRDEIGSTIRIQPTQEQLGYRNGETLFTLDVLDGLRAEHGDDQLFEIDWVVTEDCVGMGIGERVRELPASTFQSVNPIFIMILGLMFTALWAVLANLELEPSTPIKFALGLMQLGLGFGAFWYGACTADERGMVALGWLFLGYLFQTTGELCLSPVGLSMITKLSPTRLVSTVMGAWFLATAFSQFLAAIIAQFTGVTHGGNGDESTIPIPSESVDVYGGVFGKIAIAAVVSGVLLLVMSPLLRYWMHEETVTKLESE